MVSSGAIIRQASGAAWLLVPAVSIAVGLKFILDDPFIFTPGGWFALDGRRVLEATEAWRIGQDPYSIEGFLYSPVALLAAFPFTELQGPVAIIGWIATCAVILAAQVTSALARESWFVRSIAVVGALLFVPVMADLVLANVTIVLTAGVWIAVRGSTTRSGLLLGLLGAAFPKPMFIPLVIWLVVWRPRAAVGTISGGLAACAVSLIFMGDAIWFRFVEVLRAGGGINLDFVGNYGLTKVAPEIAVPVAATAVVIFMFALLRRPPGASLLAATAVGVFIAPYAGIYAAIPMAVALPGLHSTHRALAISGSLLAVLTAPSSPLIAGFGLAAALLAWRSSPLSDLGDGQAMGREVSHA